MKLLSKIFILLGIFCYALGIYNIWLSVDPNRLSFGKYTYAQTTSQDNKQFPEKIIIKDLKIDLNLIPSHVVNNKWETTDLGASYLVTSPIPGEMGNSIIYGHNWASLFGNLPYITPGEEMQIKYTDNSIKTFVVKYTSTVTPDASTILAPSKDKRITLYTCSGFLDSQRFVAVAVLKEASK